MRSSHSIMFDCGPCVFVSFSVDIALWHIDKTAAASQQSYWWLYKADIQFSAELCKLTARKQHGLLLISIPEVIIVKIPSKGICIYIYIYMEIHSVGNKS
jgi:hypothetical protein